MKLHADHYIKKDKMKLNYNNHFNIFKKAILCRTFEKITFDKIEKKMPLMKVCSNNKEDIDLLKKRILECFSFSTNNELVKKNIYNKITQNK